MSVFNVVRFKVKPGQDVEIEIDMYTLRPEAVTQFTNANNGVLAYVFYHPISMKNSANRASSTITTKIDWTTLEVVCSPTEAALPLGQRAAVEAAGHVQGRQQGQADARLARGLDQGLEVLALEQARHQAITLEPEHWGSAAFGLALASMAHERQYSRLFRS
mgnify:CR=1 FL=1